MRQERRSFERLVLEGTGLISAAALLSRLLSLASAPILTRALGPEPYGVMAMVGTAWSLGAVLSVSGIDMAYARHFFGESPEGDSAVERYCWRQAIGMALGVGIAVSLAWWPISIRTGLPVRLAPVVGVGIALQVATVMAGTRRRLREGYARMAVGTVVTGAVTLGGTIVLALWWRPDAWALLLGGLAGSAAGLSILGLPSVSFVAAPSGLPGSRRREIVAFGLAGAALAPLFWFMSSVDRWVIEARLGTGAVGVYVFATSLSQMGIFINGAITTTWFPEMTRAYTALGAEASGRLGRMWGHLVAGLLLVWLAITAAGGDALRLITDRRFHEAGAYVPWLAGGVFFYGVATLASTGLFVAKNLRPAVAWWTAGALLDGAASLVLVRLLGASGVAIANCLAFAFIAAGVMASAQRRYFLRIPCVRLASAAACVVPAGVVMSVPWAKIPAVSLLLKAPVGLAFVGIVAAIVAPDLAARKLAWWRSSGGDPR